MRDPSCSLPAQMADLTGHFTGQIFSDFGDDFVVKDTDGEEPKMSIVASISNEVDSLVTVVDDAMMEFEDGDIVTFSEVVGMEGINGAEFPVTRKGKHGFAIGDTSTMAPYVKGGIAVQVPDSLYRQHQACGSCQSLDAPLSRVGGL